MISKKTKGVEIKLLQLRLILLYNLSNLNTYYFEKVSKLIISKEAINSYNEIPTKIK